MKSLRRILGVLACLIIIIIVPPALAQDVVGDWHGTVKLPTGEDQLVIHIRKAADLRHAGSMDVPDHGISGIPLGTIAADGRTLAFDAPSVGGAYRGTWDQAQNRWKGEWTQAGATAALDLARGGAAEAPQGPFIGLDGNWDAVFVDGAQRLRIVLRIKAEATKTTTSLDSPDQGITGLAVSALRRNGAAVRIEMRSIASVVDGTLDASGQVLTGNWVGGGKSYPITFSRRAPGAGDPVAKRPQTPVKPYPYREENVDYENPAAKVRLAGTLTVPMGAGPFPAVLLIAGTGDLDRDETINDHKVFLVLADHLTRQGIAVLRVDKRGVGKSTGDFGAATTADFASDVEAGVAFLKSRPDINGRKIGLAGHSEGGLIAPLVASRDPAVAFVVLLAAPGLPGMEISVTQLVDQIKAMGQSDDWIAKYAALMREVFAAIVAARNSSEAAARAREILMASREIHGKTDEQLSVEIALYSRDWMRFFLAYDPIPALRGVNSPVLAINGSKDLLVAAKQNLAAIRRALAGNRDVETHELPGLNHLFQTANTGLQSEYGQIEETFAPAALELIAKWMVARVK